MSGQHQLEQATARLAERVTADTITDEQIRELHDTAPLITCCGPDDYLGQGELKALCSDALAQEARYNGQRTCPTHVAYPTITVVNVNRAARARCAELINARSKEAK